MCLAFLSLQFCSQTPSHALCCSTIIFLSSSKKDETQGDLSGSGHLTPKEQMGTLPWADSTTSRARAVCPPDYDGRQLVGAGQDEVVLVQRGQRRCLGQQDVAGRSYDSGSRCI